VTIVATPHPSSITEPIDTKCQRCPFWPSRKPRCSFSSLRESASTELVSSLHWTALLLLYFSVQNTLPRLISTSMARPTHLVRLVPSYRRTFSASPSHPGSPFFQLTALSNSRETQHLNRASRLSRVNHSPNLELIQDSEVKPFPTPSAAAAKERRQELDRARLLVKAVDGDVVREAEEAEVPAHRPSPLPELGRQRAEDWEKLKPPPDSQGQPSSLARTSRSASKEHETAKPRPDKAGRRPDKLDDALDATSAAKVIREYIDDQDRTISYWHNKTQRRKTRRRMLVAALATLLAVGALTKDSYRERGMSKEGAYDQIDKLLALAGHHWFHDHRHCEAGDCQEHALRHTPDSWTRLSPLAQLKAREISEAQGEHRRELARIADCWAKILATGLLVPLDYVYWEWERATEVAEYAGWLLDRAFELNDERRGAADEYHEMTDGGGDGEGEGEEGFQRLEEAGDDCADVGQPGVHSGLSNASVLLGSAQGGGSQTGCGENTAELASETKANGWSWSRLFWSGSS